VDEPVEVTELVRDIVDLVNGRARRKGLELVLEQSRDAPRFVRTDGAKLRQVLLNLIGNALKFTERGQVAVHLGAESLDTPECLNLILEVRDTGIGISAEDQLHIFDPFVQAGKLNTQKGSGLGLAITKKYVELMRGTIRVTSAPGQGSVFRVEVPVRKAEDTDLFRPAVSHGRVRCLQPGQSEHRILVVEDELENWLLLQRLLENAGFLVEVAEDGFAGVEKFLSWRPHFIWMDLDLPQLGGKEATRRIRQLDGGAETKIAAITASAIASEREGVIRAGFDDFAFKPFRPAEIFVCLARHLGVRYLPSKGGQ
jgi:CheY-like chemotaxis protein